MTSLIELICFSLKSWTLFSTSILPKDISYITSGNPVGEWLRLYLFKNQLFNSNKLGSINFYVSDAPQKFQKLGSKFLNNQITDIKLMHIE